jgi:hypothetical protein
MASQSSRSEALAVVVPEGARDLPAFLHPNRGDNLTESTISVQPRENDPAPPWLLVLVLVEIAWVAAISLTLYWLLTS